jgi:streptomycin 6-kinase
MTPQHAQSRWHLHDLSPFAQTRTSTLWRATNPEFGPVVLKILTPYGADETFGFDLMQKVAGHGMARLFARETGAALMEYLSGPSLAEKVRGGDDLGAAEIIADVARDIGAANIAGLMPLNRHLELLLLGDFASLPTHLHPIMQKARAICVELLKADDRRALHGDLHHDNILDSARGWRAIDAKGLVGDPAYEFANAFRNPEDCQPVACRTDRIMALAQIFAEKSGISVGRILQWAVAHCACSLLWSSENGDDLADDTVLLPILFTAARVDKG